MKKDLYPQTRKDKAVHRLTWLIETDKRIVGQLVMAYGIVVISQLNDGKECFVSMDFVYDGHLFRRWWVADSLTKTQMSRRANHFVRDSIGEATK